MTEHHNFSPALAKSLHDLTSNDDYFEMMAEAGRDMQEYRNRLKKLTPMEAALSAVAKMDCGGQS